MGKAFSTPLTCLALPAAQLSPGGWAGQIESEAAVAQVLFVENMENASYTVRGSGSVDILFGPAVADPDDIRIVKKLKSHPDIPGVLAGKGKTDFRPIK